MKLVILLIFVIAYSESKSQNLEIHSTDTIKLDDFKVRQVVAYKISYVTFYFSLEECKNNFLVYWRRYEEKIKEMQRRKKRENTRTPKLIEE